MESEPTLFDYAAQEISLEDVFAAYYDCRRNKRGTINALDFEIDYETKLVKLWQDINNKTYKPGRSITFIVKKPTRREIFAADFRDRVVHHLLINKLLPLLEREFNPHAYSCRTGKGTLYGVKEIYEHIKNCSENYSKECYVLKLDIEAFFMNIDKNILFSRLKQMIDCNYSGLDKDLILFLTKAIVLHAPQKNCFRKGRLKDWDDLPKSKSLFYAPDGKGLPIGNLTSQIFANFYLNHFDKYVTSLDKDLYYGRYVDDFVVVHKSKKFLSDLSGKLRDFLTKDVKLNLHPRKFYLQNYTHGLAFTGTFMLPYRMYAGRRLRSNLFNKLFTYAKRLKDERNMDLALKVVSVCNSYFGFLKHTKSFRIKRKAWRIIRCSLDWFCYSSYPFMKLSMPHYTSPQGDMEEYIGKSSLNNFMAHKVKLLPWPAGLAA